MIAIESNTRYVNYTHTYTSFGCIDLVQMLVGIIYKILQLFQVPVKYAWLLNIIQKISYINVIQVLKLYIVMSRHYFHCKSIDRSLTGILKWPRWLRYILHSPLPIINNMISIANRYFIIAQCVTLLTWRGQRKQEIKKLQEWRNGEGEG